MDALGLGLRLGFSLNKVKATQEHQKYRKIGLASQSSCFIPYQVLYKLSATKSHVQMTRISQRSLEYKCYSSKNENIIMGGNMEIEVRRKRLAIFVSGGGSNFRAINEAIVKGLIHGDVAVLVTDKPYCGGAEYARNNSIPVIVFPKSRSAPNGLSTIELVTTLRNFEVDFLLLAGYLKLIPVDLVRVFPRSILNIHPSLLPAFGGKGYYGLKVHQAVIASGARYSGPSVHFVDENYDTGRTLAQRVVPVLAKDTPEQLAARVLHEVFIGAPGLCGGSCCTM
ncbi:phosphoribosylglycinamide formyltransferase, chloroplastic isoform X2 [Typha latifolia]|uniref:phosphoribosylglycinamide formyltransferase, chloroplastic isoform X2 n=2 Tax=Typha latifolia TaxID=4733 RepID=UPI003C2E8097